MYTVYECTDSPKFTMKLTEIYRYMATHDSHSKFWACDADLTELIVCRKSRFLLENRPRVRRGLIRNFSRVVRLEKSSPP